MRARTLMATIAVPTLIPLSLAASASPGETPHHGRGASPAAAPSPSVEPVDGLGFGPALITRHANLVFLLTVAANNETRAREAAAHEAAARARASHSVQAEPSSDFRSSSSISGSCAAMAPPGFPDYIIERESGGNPTAQNASGAYGCAQLMPMHLTDAGYAADWARLWANGAGACNWQPPNYCAG